VSGRRQARPCRRAESVGANRADAAAPAQTKAAAGQESPARATSAGALGATAAAPAKRPAQLTGRVTYRTRAALPAGAVIDVRLLDVSRMDAPATLLGRVEIVTRGEQVPVPFTIGYDAAAIDSRFRYTVQVTITVEGRVAYRTTTAHPVLTNGAPATNVEVVVEPMR
jgi:putative lipoprotein